MNILQEWINALESGEYQQIRNSYRRDNCFCALGVLADVIVKNTDYEWDPFAGLVDGRGNIWAVSHILYNYFDNNDILTAVMVMNDDDFRSFSEIAEYLKGKVENG